MPLRNRVTPFGDLVATPARGLVYGNRGCLHDADGGIRRRWNGTRWIACRLEFRGRRRGALQRPGRYTELFFLDEATAFAAGHRPCAECRREDFDRFAGLWTGEDGGRPRAGAIDERLHAERVDAAAGERLLHERPLDELPDGAFVVRDGEPWLVRGAQLLRWTPAGYAERVRRQRGVRAALLTPPSLVAVLAAGWRPAVPLLHPSARRALRSRALSGRCGCG